MAWILTIAAWRAAEPATAELDVRLQELAVDQAAVRDYLPDLEVRAAFALTSSDSRFGGISGALIEGRTIWLLSDRAHLFKAQIVEDSTGRILDLVDWQVSPLREGNQPVDSEALAWTANGDIAVAIEGRHRIRCLDRSQPDYQLNPCGLAPVQLGLDSNAGIEALVSMDDHGLLALVESAGGDGRTIPALAVFPDRVSVLAYRAAPAFRPTGADRLDARAYVLERRLSLLGGWQARIVQLNRADLADQPIDGRELGRFGVGMAVDNFEAIAARHGRNGADELLIFSDDNFLPAQRTLFYQLAVKDGMTTN